MKIVGLCVVVLACVVGVVVTKSDRALVVREVDRTSDEATRGSGVSRPMISVHIDAEPAGAHVTLDGARIEVPFGARIESDGRIHHVVVSAEGFVSEERAVVFDRDLSIAFALREPEPDDEGLGSEPGATTQRRGGARAALAPVTPTSSAMTTDAPQVAPQPSVQREPTSMTSTRMAPIIDSDDPYQ